MSLEKWDQRYQEGEMPWDTGMPDFHLVKYFGEKKPPVKKALEIGCGTGTNAIWMANQGIDVSAIDLSPKAIEIANQNAVEEKVDCKFVANDFLQFENINSKFDFAFDRGCFHSFESNFLRVGFAQKLAGLLGDKGNWLSLIGSADSQHEEGPPKRSVLDIAAAVEGFFEILELKAVKFNPGEADSPGAWNCLMRKR